MTNAAVEWGYFMRDGHNYRNISINRPFRVTKAYVKDNARFLDSGTSVEIRVENRKTGSSFPLCVLNKAKPMTSIDLQFEQEADLVFRKITTGKLVDNECPNLLGIQLEGYYLDGNEKPSLNRCAAWIAVVGQMSKLKCQVEKVFIHDEKEFEESEEVMKILKRDNTVNKQMVKVVLDKNKKMKNASKIMGTVKEEFVNLEEKIGILAMENCLHM